MPNPAGRPRGNPEHGTPERWRKPHNCRCAPCSQANSAWRRNYESEYRAARRAANPIPETYTCHRCEGVYQRRTLKGRCPDFCPDCRKLNKIDSREPSNEQRRQKVEQRIAGLACEDCGARVTPTVRSAQPRFCTKHADERREARLRIYAERRRQAHRPLIPRKCERCEDQFTCSPRGRSGRIPSFCEPCRPIRKSERKAQRVKEAPEIYKPAQAYWARVRQMRKRGVPSQAYNRQQVFERDSGVCHLCGLTVDRGSRWHIDHILPLWLYGTIPGVNDSLENVAVSHQRCNNRKGSGYYILYAFIDLKAHFQGDDEFASAALLERILSPLSELEQGRLLKTWRSPLPKLDAAHAVFTLPRARRIRRKFSSYLNPAC